MRTEDVFVATTIRFYYDATIAVALATVFALVVSLIAAVIVGGNGPNASVAFVVFMLTGAILLFRWWRGWQGSGSRPFLMVRPIGRATVAHTGGRVGRKC
jgi:hypothetical protein